MKWYYKLGDKSLNPEEKDGALGDGLEKMLNTEVKKKWERDLLNKYGVSRSRRKKKIIPWIAGIAAMFLLCIGAYFLIQNSMPPEELANKYLTEWNDVSNPNLMRKEVNPIDDKRNQANLASSEGEFEKAIEIYEQISPQERTRWDHYYLGIAYLKSDPKNMEKSKAYLNKSLKLKGPEEEITWLRSLIYIMYAQNDSACISLHKLIEWNQYKVEESKLILQSLKREGYSCQKI